MEIQKKQQKFAVFIPDYSICSESVVSATVMECDISEAKIVIMNQ
ncbi:hypothetical protein ACFP3I_00860 [Chryseobacterium arachidis]